MRNITSGKKKIKKDGSIKLPKEFLTENSLIEGDELYFCKDWEGRTFLIGDNPEDEKARHEYCRDSKRDLSETHNDIDFFWNDAPSRKMIKKTVEVIRYCRGKEQLEYTHTSGNGRIWAPDSVQRYINIWIDVGEGLMRLVDRAMRQKEDPTDSMNVLLGYQESKEEIHKKLYSYLPNIWRKAKEDDK